MGEIKASSFRKRNLSRRQFVTAVSTAVAWATLSHGKNPEIQPWRMRLSTSSIHYMGLPIEQACAKIARLGFEAVDVWSAHQGCPHLDDVQKRLGPSGLKDLLETTKLKLFSFSVYKGGYEKYAKLLGDAGGGVAVRGSGKKCPPNELSTRMKAFLEGLKPLVELAEANNSYLAIENHGNALLDSLDSFKAFTDLNDHPRLGLALAPYHLQGIKASVPEAIRICGKQLFFFYAWQRARGAEQLPGVGTTEMTPWIKALADIRYTGYVNAFMHGHPAPDEMSRLLAQSKTYLEACYKQVIGKGKTL